MPRLIALVVAVLMLFAAAPMASASDSLFSEGEQAESQDRDQDDKKSKKSKKDKKNNGKRHAKGKLGDSPGRHDDDRSDDDRDDDSDDSSDDDDSDDRPTPTNTAPVASMVGGGSVDVGAVVGLDASGSSDADGDALTFLWSVDQAPAISTAGVVGSGSTVTIMPDVAGTYVVSVTVSDGVATAVASVSIDATIPNGAPSAVDDSYAIVEGSTLNAGSGGFFSPPGVLSNDSDPEGDALTAVVESRPQFGSLTFNADGSFDYVPNAGFAGVDTFTYRVSDGSSSAVGVVSIQVIDLP